MIGGGSAEYIKSCATSTRPQTTTIEGEEAKFPALLYSIIGEELGADDACDRHSDDVHQHLDGGPCMRCVDATPVQHDR